VSRYQKGKTNLDFTEARDSERQWHQLSHMQVCTLLQTDSHTSTHHSCFFTGRMPFLPPNQQRQSTEGNYILRSIKTQKKTKDELHAQNMSILHLSPYFYCSVLYSVRIWMLVLISHTAHCVYTLMSAVYSYQSTITYDTIRYEMLF